MKKEDARGMSRLDNDQLDGVSGGLIFYAGDIEGADKDNPWELLDDTDGRTLGRYPEKDDAIAASGAKGKNHMIVNWTQVQELRGQK